MRVERTLVLETDPQEVARGEPIAVRVRDTRGKPVEGATVRTRRRKLARTDERGRCRVRFRSPGFWKLVAFKPPAERVTYEPASALVRVVPPTPRPRERTDSPPA